MKKIKKRKKWSREDAYINRYGYDAGKKKLKELAENAASYRWPMVIQI